MIDTDTCVLCGTTDDVDDELCIPCRELMRGPRLKRHGVWRLLQDVTVTGELL